MTGRPSVVIVGAGIVGASLACHLASAGVAVTIVERSRPASGVTARSFAWINVVHGNAPVLAQLRNLAIADYRRLERELNGALTWSEDPAESERAVAEHTAWGYDVRLVEEDEIRRLEPHLVAPPPVAAHAPGEGALDPVAATLALVGAAREAGARLVKGTEVKALATTDGRVSGVALPPVPLRMTSCHVPALLLIHHRASSLPRFLASRSPLRPPSSDQAARHRSQRSAPDGDGIHLQVSCETRGRLDVPDPGPLFPAGQQHDHRAALLLEVRPVARSVADPQRPAAPKPLRPRASRLPGFRPPAARREPGHGRGGFATSAAGRPRPLRRPPSTLRRRQCTGR